jgi:hypothetical protein
MITGERDIDDLLLPRPIKEVPRAVIADANRRLAVTLKMSVPYEEERRLLKIEAMKERDANDVLNQLKDVGGLDRKITEIKDDVHVLTKQMRMYEKGESKEKDRLLEERKSRQRKLEILNKFSGENDPRIEASIRETAREIEVLDRQVAVYEKNGYKEKVRLDTEREQLRTRLETLEKFREKIRRIVRWQETIRESENAVFPAWALEQDPEKLETTIKFYTSLKEIEAQ